MHTIERISTITIAQVEARLELAHDRHVNACKEMTERHYRRGSPPIVASDMPELMLPDMPVIPTTLAQCLTNPNGFYNHEHSATAIHRDNWGHESKLTAPFSRWNLIDKTPEHLVAAILAADDLAREAESRAADYREATALVVATHCTAQAQATRVLTGLVGQATV